jgi:hypothetical protein
MGKDTKPKSAITRKSSKSKKKHIGFEDDEGNEDDKFDTLSKNNFTTPSNGASRGFHRQPTPFPHDINQNASPQDEYDGRDEGILEDDSRHSRDDNSTNEIVNFDTNNSNEEEDVYEEQHTNTPATNVNTSKSQRSLKRQATPYPDDLKKSTTKVRDKVLALRAQVDDRDADLEYSTKHSSKVSYSDETKYIDDDTEDNDISRATPKASRPEFRREYSGDHPLAGGSGKYKKEISSGKKAKGPIGHTSVKAEPIERLSEIVSKQEQRKLENQKQLDALRKRQNEALLKVLDEERRAEDTRSAMGKSVTDPKERSRYISMLC